MGAISADNLPNLKSDNKNISALVPDTAEVVEIYDKWLESVKFYISNFCDEMGIENLTTATQNQFTAALKVIGRKLFKNSTDIRTTVYTDAIKDNFTDTYGSDTYDPDKMAILLDLFVFLCDSYDKAVSVRGFCNLSGMSVTEYYRWLEGSGASKNHWNFAKNIKDLRHDSLTDILTTAKRNPVGILGILNHEYGWNMPGVTRENKRVVALEADQLPDLGAIKSANLTSEKTTTEGYKLPTMPEKAFKQ